MDMPTKLKLKRVQTCSGCVACDIVNIDNPILGSPKSKHICQLGYSLIANGVITKPAIPMCPKPLNTNELAGVIAINNLIAGDYQVEMKFEQVNVEPVKNDDKPKRHTSEVDVILCDCIHRDVCKMHNDMSELHWRLSHVAHEDWPCKNIGQTIQILVQCSYRVKCHGIHDDDMT